MSRPTRASSTLGWTCFSTDWRGCAKRKRRMMAKEGHMRDDVKESVGTTSETLEQWRAAERLVAVARRGKLAAQVAAAAAEEAAEAALATAQAARAALQSATLAEASAAKTAASARIVVE